MEESIYFKKVYFKDELPPVHTNVWFYTISHSKYVGWLSDGKHKMINGTGTPSTLIENCSYWLKEV